MPWLLKKQRRGMLARFAANKLASVNIIFAFSILPLVGIVGMGVDFSVAQAVKNKLDNAADAAAVAAVATAKAYVANNSSDKNLTADAIAAGTDRAGRAFTTNAGNLAFSQLPSTTNGTLTITLNRSSNGMVFTSTVSYSTTTQNHFGQLFGTPTMSVKGTSAATASIPQYLDFYLLVDVSGSMGLPANQSDQTAMLNAVGCQFACHFPGSGNTAGWNYAMQNNIVLRSGAVNSAVCSLLTQATNQMVTNQYRVGVYPFITQMATLAALSTSISNVQSETGCNQSNPTTFTNLLDTGTTQLGSSSYYIDGTGSGGTDFTATFPGLQKVISNGAGFGNGSASNNSKPFVFLVTDGMDNTQAYGTHTYQNKTYSGIWAYPGTSNSNFQNVGWLYGANANNTGATSEPQTIDPTVCTSLKQAGATISVLYIPYAQLTVGSSNQSETQQADNAIPSLPNALTQCAGTSAGTDGATWIHTANSAADINSALTQMFQQAVQAAHLTQ